MGEILYGVYWLAVVAIVWGVLWLVFVDRPGGTVTLNSVLAILIVLTIGVVAALVFRAVAG
jgi:hypothetical protein